MPSSAVVDPRLARIACCGQYKGHQCPCNMPDSYPLQCDPGVAQRPVGAAAANPRSGHWGPWLQHFLLQRPPHDSWSSAQAQRYHKSSALFWETERVAERTIVFACLPSYLQGSCYLPKQLTRQDEMRWDETRWQTLRRHDMRWNKMRWDDTDCGDNVMQRTISNKNCDATKSNEMGKNPNLKKMVPEWKVTRLLMQNTEGLPARKRHSLGSAL